MSKGYGYPETEANCIMQPGDHPFIVDTTRIAYEYAREWCLTQIEKGIQLGTCRTHADVSHRLLKRIQQGAKVNEDIEIGLEDYFDYF